MLKFNTYLSCNCRKGEAETPEEGIDERMLGDFDEDIHHGDLHDTGGVELDGDPDGETWPSQESNDSECESELFVHSEHSEEMSDNDDDNSRLEDEVDDVTEEDDDSDDE